MTMHYRATVTPGDGFDFVLSDGTMDRHGTRINPNGWDLTEFLKNPVALWAHGTDSVRGRVPIGRWENLRIQAAKLLGRLVLADEGTSDFVDELRRLVAQQILRAVSVGMDFIELGKPGGKWEIERAGLREVSLVPVGSNTNALKLARSLDISESTIRTVFGEQANEDDRGAVTPGEQAAKPKNEARARAGLPPLPKGKSMPTLAERIEALQDSIAADRDRLAELNAADVFDQTAVDELNSRIDSQESELATRKASEAKIGLGAAPAGTQPPAPAINRMPLGYRQREISGIDLLVRRALVHAVALYTDRDIDRVLEERYPGHEATAHMVRAAAPLGTTTNPGFVQELVQVTYASFLDALRGKSIYPEVRARGYGVSFDQAGIAYLPQLNAGGANGSFFGEGQPIRVGRITVGAPTFTSKKMGVIIPFSREAARRSTPALEPIIRRAIIDDTAAVLDTILLDNGAETPIRPAGLLNGVTPVAGGYGGGDHEFVKEDFKALLQPFIDANAADGITVIMNPAQSLSIGLMDGPTNNAAWFNEIAKRVTIVESTHATAKRLVALRNSDFATAMGDVPEFEVSNQATIHMEDTAPAEIVSATGPTTANPVRSFWQTDSMGVRMVMDVSWKMARAGMVQFIDNTSY
ncbi:hypothetical protein [Mesorhizobium amorphae]